jgi:hypothetical protein
VGARRAPRVARPRGRAHRQPRAGGGGIGDKHDHLSPR